MVEGQGERERKGGKEARIKKKSIGKRSNHDKINEKGEKEGGKGQERDDSLQEKKRKKVEL